MSGGEMDGEIAICEPGGKGLVLPWGDHDWPRFLRAVLYAIGLAYCFLGVAIVADMFMAAIEAVTKRRRRKTLESGQIITVYVWNDTVANLSLMALGSSAPEIFLSLIDLFRKGMHSSELGSATIVGSASFNLLVIVSVCIICIPSGEIRHIEQYSVFIVTGLFSLFAYLWLAFILVVRTPNVVEVWEAVATLLCLPVLIGMSYLADIGKLDCGARFILGPEAKEADENPVDTVNAGNEDFVAKVSPGASIDGDSPLDRTPPPALMTSSLSRSASSVADAPRDQCKKMISISEEEPAVGNENAVTISVPCLHARLSEQRELEVPQQQQQQQQQRLSMRSFSGNLKKRDSQKKNNRLNRGFSLHSFASNNAEETPATGYQRRKSIAAHHQLAINRLRKSQTLDRDSGHSKEMIRLDQSPEGSASVTVQLLIDRMFISASLPAKTIKLVRQGAPSVELRVEYSLNRCTTPTDRLTITKVAVAKYPQGDAALEMMDGPVEWLNDVDSEEVTTKFLVFPADQVEAHIVVDNPVHSHKRSCNDFVFTLVGVSVAEETEGPCVEASLGHIRSTYVISESEPSPGMFSFPCEFLAVPATRQQHKIEVVVVRQGGCLGQMSCDYFTEALSAVANKDYVETSGSLTFEEGVTEMTVEIWIHAKAPSRVARVFLLVLKAQEDDDSARFDPTNDGGEDSAILTITIGELEADSNPIVRQLDTFLNLSHWVVGFEDWKGQFRSAILCNGSLEAQAEASLTDWLFHVVSLPWMLFFALIPPTSFCGGWICFYTCLLFIAACTAIIADLAELFGCVLEVPDIVTAITFVALGTSMPDLFASKVAATEDPTADASIVNVTGSNSVNVFLGLGLPWTIAAIFWAVRARDEDWIQMYPDIAAQYPGISCVFAVPAANLGFSIVCFCVACLSAILLLILRRRLVHGELGGPGSAKVATTVVLICFWVGYVVIVSWRALRYDKASSIEQLGVVVGIFIMEGLLALVPCYLYFRVARQEAASARGLADRDGKEVGRADPPSAHSDGSTTAPGDSIGTAAASGFLGERDAAAEREALSEARPDDDEPGDVPTVPLEPEASRAQEKVPRQMLESSRL